MDGGGHDGGHHGGHHHGGFGSHHGHHHSDDSPNWIPSHSHHQGGQWTSKRGWQIVGGFALLLFALMVFA